MKKNIKGFTLVELLAAIIVLGVISVFAIPHILGLLSGSRNKIYVSDARKLIAQAEYKIRADNTGIERPEPNDCIVMSLAYLDNADFDVAPNGGDYQRENSFVVIKNNGGQLEYAVTLVEKTSKGTYFGLELISEKLLIEEATEHITSFAEGDLMNANTGITKDEINQRLAGYLPGELVAIYNNPDISDEYAFDANNT